MKPSVGRMTLIRDEKQETKILRLLQSHGFSMDTGPGTPAFPCSTLGAISGLRRRGVAIENRVEQRGRSRFGFFRKTQFTGNMIGNLPALADYTLSTYGINNIRGIMVFKPLAREARTTSVLHVPTGAQDPPPRGEEKACFPEIRQQCHSKPYAQAGCELQMVAQHDAPTRTPEHGCSDISELQRPHRHREFGDLAPESRYPD